MRASHGRSVRCCLPPWPRHRSPSSGAPRAFPPLKAISNSMSSSSVRDRVRLGIAGFLNPYGLLGKATIGASGRSFWTDARRCRTVLSGVLESSDFRASDRERFVNAPNRESPKGVSTAVDKDWGNRQHSSTMCELTNSGFEERLGTTGPACPDSITRMTIHDSSSRDGSAMHGRGMRWLSTTF